jgi:hypothetical protein
MEIVFNDQEEKAIQTYADKHNLTYGEGLQKMIDAMTKGLVELAAADDEFNVKNEKYEQPLLAT